MLRAIKVTLKYATQCKQQKIEAILAEYTRVLNQYIKACWSYPTPKLNKECLDLVDKGRLSARFQSNALKQALEVVKGTKASSKATGNKASMPVFRGGATLDAKFVTVEQGLKSFDLVLRLSTLSKGNRILIPTRSTRVLNKWLAKPGAQLRNACILKRDYITLFVEIPDTPLKENGIDLGLDLGMNKLAVTSDGAQYGTGLKPLLHAIKNCKQKSKRQKRLRIHRDNYIRQELNKLPWGAIKTLAVENLKNMKLGKSKKRSKNFRKLLSPWVYSRMLNWINLKSQENRVRLESVSPAYTSQSCPECLHTEKENRKNEDFKCLRCGYHADADFVGSRNILQRFHASVESARCTTSTAIEIYA